MRLILFFLFLFSFQFSSAAESIRADHLQIDWLAPEIFSNQSETLVGIRFRPDPHWHVYWKNPGDSGAAPKFQITANGTPINEILWPYPTRLPVAHLTNLGYEGETAYLFKVKPDATQTIAIEAKLEWLVCKEECIPGFGTLTLYRPVSDQPVQFQTPVQEKLQFFTARVPESGANSPLELKLSESADGSPKLEITSKRSLPESVDAFPVELEYILPAEPKKTSNDHAFEIIFPKSESAAKPNHLGFVLVADGKAYEFANVPFSSAPATESASLAVLFGLLASAFLGGILLNLMPCVFPVISIKAVSLLKTPDRKSKIRDGVQYTLGVLITFVGLGIAFLILRQLGTAVGWGFQLQSPVVVFALIVLFWLMALNFLGVFEFGTAVMNSSGRLNWQSSFGTGVLSVFVAAPCTGPFMGTALGATSTLPSYQALFVFLFLGIGLAFPYLMITLSDRLARALPRPGAWMDTLKQFFSFPLFATVLWLLWVLGLQTGTQGWFYAGLALLVISFSLWLGKRQRKFWKPLAWILALTLTAYSAQIIRTSEPEATTATSSKWVPYDEAKLQAAIESGQPVFVDFTAAWCITCQVNKKAVLETTAADEIFQKHSILRMRADWTKQDPIITEALSRLGRNSVPVYAFYSKKNSQPLLLPQILTIAMINELIPKEEK